MKNVLLIFTTLSLLTLGACTSVPVHMALNTAPPKIVANKKKATLVMTRQATSAFTYGSAAHVNVFLDDDFIGQNSTYSYFIKLVNPGKHYVFSHAIAPLTATPISVAGIKFKAGKIYYLMHSVRQPPMAFTTLVTTDPAAPGDITFADMMYLDFKAQPGTLVIHDEDKKAAIKDFEDNPGNYKSILDYKGY